MKEPERMNTFFDARAGSYEEHMKKSIADFADFYGAVASPIEKTSDPIRVLDLGAGTGLELEQVFAIAPNARITVVDISSRMTARLMEKFADRERQIEVIHKSFNGMSFGDSMFDYAIAVMSMHHFMPDAKLDIYRRIQSSLRDGGMYIEGDWYVSTSDEIRMLAEYKAKKQSLAFQQDGEYHLDIPFSLETQRELIEQAGFRSFDPVWQSEDDKAVFRAY